MYFQLCKYSEKETETGAEIETEIGRERDRETNAYSTHFLHTARGDIESVQSCSSRFTGIALLQGVSLNILRWMSTQDSRTKISENA